MATPAEPTTPNALIFDIETIADLTPENRDAIAALAAHREMTPEEYGSLCPPLARVACVVWFDVAQHRAGALFDATLGAGDQPPSLQVEYRSATPFAVTCDLAACNGEADLLRQLGRLIEAHCRQVNPQLVTYNGRGFDLPVLIHRCLKHQVSEGRELLIKAVRENRYQPLLHLDLLDEVTFYGATNRWPMAAYAIGYGFRSPKSDMDGSQVGAAVCAGRIIDVVRYCAGDVLATAHVYLTLRGRLPAPAVSPDG